MNIGHSIRRIALCVALGLGLPTAAMALGTEFTYQGELRESGAPLNGSVDFEFRLYDAVTAGSQLGATRTLNGQLISNGVFTAALDFGDQFTGAPRWLEISVRRTGLPTFTALQPRQPLTATPYAQHADFVADNSIVGANILDGSVGGVDLAISSVSTTQIQNGGVATIDLADSSVTTAKLANDAVTTAKLATGSVGTSELIDASVTAAKLAAGSVGAAQINTAQVQARLIGQCPSGLPLLGFDASANALCDDAVVYLAQGLRFPALRLTTSNVPLVVGIDTTANDLILSRCGDPACSDGEVRLVLDTEVGNSGAVAFTRATDTNSLFIAYHDAAVGDLHAFDCVGPTCGVANFRPLDTSGNAGIGVDVMLRAGNVPFVTYLANDAGNTVLRAYDCDNAACSSGVVRELDAVNVSDSSRVSVSAITSTGVPIIFYSGEGASEGLNAYVCGNIDCTSGTSYDLNDDAPLGIDSTSRGAFPMVAYTGTGGAVTLFDCSGLGCSFGTTRTLTTTSLSSRVSIVHRDGDAPLVAYHEGAAIKVYDCDNQFCSTGSVSVVASGSDIEGSPQIVLRSDDRPVLLHEDTAPTGSTRPRIDLCGNLACRQ